MAFFRALSRSAWRASKIFLALFVLGVIALLTRAWLIGEVFSSHLVTNSSLQVLALFLLALFWLRRAIIGVALAAFVLYGDRHFVWWVKGLMIGSRMGFSWDGESGTGFLGLSLLGFNINKAILVYAYRYVDPTWTRLAKFAVIDGTLSGLVPSIPPLLFAMATMEMRQWIRYINLQAEISTCMICTILLYKYIYTSPLWRRRLLRMFLTIAASVASMLILTQISFVTNVASRATLGMLEAPDYANAKFMQWLQAYEKDKYEVKNRKVFRLPPFSFDKALQMDEIRLLELKVRKLGQPPRAQLTRYNLTSNDSVPLPSYTAISYIADEGALSHVLPVALHDGSLTHMNITDAVYDALYREQSFYSTKFIWIDAICVNLSNPDEKAQQASSVKRTFETASRVNAYLNASLDASAMGTQLNLVYYTKWESMPANSTFFKYEPWIGMMTFLNETWFSQAWTLPQVIPARRLYIVYQSSSFNWEVLSNVFLRFAAGDLEVFRKLHRSQTEQRNSTMVKNNKFTLAKSKDDVILDDRFIIALSMALFRTKLNAGLSTYLEELISAGLRTQAAEPRDKIFAFRALVPPAPYWETLDYKSAEKTIFSQVMSGLLRETGNLNHLSIAGASAPANVSLLPSWVSDWHSDRITHTDLLPDLFNASNGKAWPIPVDETEYELPVLALRLDTIESMFASPIDGELEEILSEDEEKSRTIDRKWWKDTIESGRKEVLAQYANESSFYDAFWRTALTDRLVRKQRRRLNESDSNVIKMLGEHINHGSANPEVEDDSSPEAALLAQMHREAIIRRSFKRMASTSSARMGMFPKKAQEGDEIVLLAGATMPFVVRKVGTWNVFSARYELVGQCYVHGVMDGEAANGTWTTITLV